jgi:hypothetical protein
MCVAAAVAGATLGGALISSNAAKSAANTQANAANTATAAQQAMYGQTLANLQPYMAGGNTALSTLNSKEANGSLGGSFTPADYLSNQDPGYAFQLGQGQQALQNSQAAKDGVLSGSALKGLIQYNQGVASTGYQNAYDRWLSSQKNTLSTLMGPATLGENAAAGAGTAGANYAGGISSTTQAAGNATAAGTVGSANAISNGLSNGSGYLYLNSLLNKNGGVSPGALATANASSDPIGSLNSTEGWTV